MGGADLAVDNATADACMVAKGPVAFDFATHPHVTESEVRQRRERAQLLDTLGVSNSAERRARARALPAHTANVNAAMALDIPAMLATKRRATDDAWNKDRLGEARAGVEELKATMNAHVLDISNAVFDANIAALHNAVDKMQHEAAKHREFDA